MNTFCAMKIIRLVACGMTLSERVHGLNLLETAQLSEDDLKIAMRELNHEEPENTYKQAKKALKKYFRCSSISKLSKNNADAVTVLQGEPVLGVAEKGFLVSSDES